MQEKNNQKKIILFDLDGVLLVNREKNSELLAYIQKIRAHGVFVAILSNFSAAAAQAFRTSEPELFSYIDQSYFAGETGRYKPDRSAFLKPIAEHGLSPEQAIFVDDSKENVDAAQKFGIDAIFYQTNSELFARLTQLIPEK